MRDKHSWTVARARTKFFVWLFLFVWMDPSAVAPWGRLYCWSEGSLEVRINIWALKLDWVWNIFFLTLIISFYILCVLDDWKTVWKSVLLHIYKYENPPTLHSHWLHGWPPMLKLPGYNINMYLSGNQDSMLWLNWEFYSSGTMTHLQILQSWNIYLFLVFFCCNLVLMWQKKFS